VRRPESALGREDLVREGIRPRTLDDLTQPSDLYFQSFSPLVLLLL
jgi:hypothetical protein